MIARDAVTAITTRIARSVRGVATPQAYGARYAARAERLWRSRCGSVAGPAPPWDDAPRAEPNPMKE